MSTEIDLTACEVMVLRDVGCLCKSLLASNLLVLALTNFQLSLGVVQHSDELMFQMSCSDKLAKSISCKGHTSVHSADSMARHNRGYVLRDNKCLIYYRKGVGTC